MYYPPLCNISRFFTLLWSNFATWMASLCTGCVKEPLPLVCRGRVCILCCFSCVWLSVTLWTVAPRLLCPWHSPGENTGGGCHALLLGIFLTQGSNPCLLCLPAFLWDWNSSWAILNPKRWRCESAAFNMPANLKNPAMATGLEKLSFHSNPKERQCQVMFKLPHNCTHLTC